MAITIKIYKLFMIYKDAPKMDVPILDLPYKDDFDFISAGICATWSSAFGFRSVGCMTRDSFETMVTRDRR